MKSVNRAQVKGEENEAAGNKGNSRREPVHVVQQVESVCYTHDPEDGQEKVNGS
ncbi:MAG: hypothetical protein JRJ66_03930 [Deltaproteobacteria bacterium]|nr:hypothetical protein [Deltaproteobacteria bacterium]